MKPSLIHICIHQRLVNYNYPFNLIDRQRVLKMLGEVYHIPKEKRLDVIKELEESGLIEAQGRSKIRVINQLVS